jgi:hypothetical protein
MNKIHFHFGRNSSGTAIDNGVNLRNRLHCPHLRMAVDAAGVRVNY